MNVIDQVYSPFHRKEKEKVREGSGEICYYQLKTNTL